MYTKTMSKQELMQELTKLGVKQTTLKELRHRLDLAMVTSGINTHEGEAAKVTQLMLQVLEGMARETQQNIDETSHQLKGRASASAATLN